VKGYFNFPRQALKERTDAA